MTDDRAPGPGRASASGQALPQGTGKLGMTLFLVALGVLFAASMVGYLIVRLRAPAWPPEGSPRLPGGLWISTLILLASSVTMHRASTGARRGRTTPLRRWLWTTFALGLLFLVSQGWNWAHLVSAHHLPAQANMYAFTFYLLSGLHGAHVLGGLVPLAITSVRSGRHAYSAEAHDGVQYMSMYWHFLDAVWIVMFIVMMIAA